MLQDGSLLPPHYKHLTLFVVLCQCVVLIYSIVLRHPSPAPSVTTQQSLTHSLPPVSLPHYFPLSLELGIYPLYYKNYYNYCIL